MAGQNLMLRLQNQHISSVSVDDMATEETFKHHLSMGNNHPHPDMIQWLKNAGFYHATFIRGYKLIPGLITALIERWRPETHTFHMPCGECTITLEDVVMLIGLPVNGSPLVKETEDSVAKLCYDYLQKVPTDIDVRGSRIKLSWLQREFQLGANNTPQDISCATRAYILQLIGGILMPDKSGNLVHARYLPFLSTALEAGSYSWGSAILAFLYRELCKAALLDSNGAKARGVGGCLLLLQAWAWERLPFFTPITRSSINFPLVSRWNSKKAHTKLAHNNVRVFRAYIDLSCENEFIWRPYVGGRINVPQPLMTDSYLWCAVTPMIHFAFVEYQFGDRVLKQFGFHQPIPRDPLNHDTLHRVDFRGRGHRAWEIKHAKYVNIWNNRNEQLPARTPMQIDDLESDNSEYMFFYRNNGRPYLTTLEEREQCQLFVKKYGGRGQSSNSAADEYDSEYSTPHEHQTVGGSSNANLVDDEFYHQQPPIHHPPIDGSSIANPVDDRFYHPHIPNYHPGVGGSSIGNPADDRFYHPQPPIYHPGVGGSSVENSVDDLFYHPQPPIYHPRVGGSSAANPDFYHSQSSMYPSFGGNIDYESITDFMAYTSINSPTFSPNIGGPSTDYVYTTPPTMAPMIDDDDDDDSGGGSDGDGGGGGDDDDDDDDDGDVAPQRPQRVRRPPQCYLSTTPRHGQKLHRK